MDYSIPPTPPTQPVEPMHFVPPSRWPTVLGIVSSVLGALGILGALSQIVSPWLIEMTKNLARHKNDSQAQAWQALVDWKYPLLLVGLGSLALAVMLLICGIKLLGRHASARALFHKWAMAKIIWSVLAVGINVAMQYMQITHAASAQSSGPVPQSLTHITSLVVIAISLAFGLLFAWALPVFMFIWLRRKTITEEISHWQP